MKDHFSQLSSRYAAFRPRYPAALFDDLEARSPDRHRGWDCATGNGQAALGLAARFRHVVAADAGREQLSRAVAHPRIDYVLASAEEAPFRDRSFSLITVAQALHWFDRPRFYSQARRLLRPGGLLAVWCYGLHRIEPGIDGILRRYYERILGPYWPPERRLVEEGYRSIEFPFEEEKFPELEIVLHWSLEEELGYLGSWSAGRRFQERTGRDPRERIAGELREAWGDPERPRKVRWRLHGRLGRVVPPSGGTFILPAQEKRAGEPARGGDTKHS